MFGIEKRMLLRQCLDAGVSKPATRGRWGSAGEPSITGSQLESSSRPLASPDDGRGAYRGAVYARDDYPRQSQAGQLWPRSLESAVVTRPGGSELDPAAILSLALVNRGSGGFTWDCRGGGPEQLALALLLDHTGNPGRAIRHHQAFAAEVVARWAWPRDLGTIAWVLPVDELDAWLQGREQRRRTRARLRRTTGLIVILLAITTLVVLTALVVVQD